MLKRSLLALSIVSALAGCALEGDDGATGATGPAGETGQTGQPGKDLPRELSVEIVGRFNTGIYGKSAAEIVQFHRTSQSVFAINAALNQIEVIPLANLPVAAVGNGVTDDSLSSTAFTFPDSVSLIDDTDTPVTQALGEANSIAIYQDLLAIAVAAPVKTDNGAVLFYRLSATGEGSFIKAVRVGALPDMLTFTPDGKTMFINIQHPGEVGSHPNRPASFAPYANMDAFIANNPTAFSKWPDGATSGRPRSGTVVIRKNDGGVIGT